MFDFDAATQRLTRWSLIGALVSCAVTSVAAQPATPTPAPIAASSGGTQAAATPDTTPLPSATEILERHVEALGGEAAIRRHRHATWNGTFTMPGMGLEGKVVLQASAPNLFRLVVEAEGIGTISQGYDGKVGWSDNPMTGPTLTQGGELEMLAIQSNFYADLDYAKHYPKIEVVGRETFAGEPCYKLKVTTAGGLDAFHYFSVESGLLVGVAGDLPTPMGEVFVETEIGGYQLFDGRLYPTRNHQRAMGSEQVLTVRDPDFGEIDPSVYALPETIRTLAGATPQP